MLGQQLQTQAPVARARATPFRLQHTRRVRLVSASAAAGAVGQPTEPAALAAFKAAHGDTKEACLALLEKAATTKSVDPEIVEGALVWLEDASKGQGCGVPSVDGSWRLVFSTSTDKRFFQYIPVNENLKVNTGSGAISLESELGPFNFIIGGAIQAWRAESGELDFQFDTVDILLFGNKVWTVKPKTQPKTYTFYYVGSRISAARSSAGGLSLMLT